ncbi:carbohydrate-binding protein [Reichenbachiella ulvae]|uniref:Carbohydrate-binding protein n=1 Tax=Reichenbachiella ulvae TaxID=2980104 RepID=A0ABT3CVC0_9BACT|nr:carbohydrate-binding protein [Reichenbachiella ulvae]MCV9387420.1 carbohydrate-binding protein [Reichenbachiella ulvae]
MKSINKLKRNLLYLAFAGLAVAACEEEDLSGNMQFEPGTIEATVSETAITNGTSVKYTDFSTKVQTRKWTFNGGDPASSTDSVVNVTYPWGGDWEAILEIKFIDNSVKLDTFLIEVDGPSAPASLPYSGSPAAVPGTIEAEDYDLGTSGLAYYDTDAGNNAINSGSPVYRTDNDTEGNVDVQVNDPGVTNIGWTSGGEWLNYTVDVASAGTHTIDFVLGSDPGGFSVQLSKINGEDTTFIAESGDFSSTGGWSTYKSFKVAAELEEGVQLWHLYLTGGSTNVDKLVITEGEPVIDAVVEATASSLVVNEGESITFTDKSTIVADRTWTFEGGDPATSTEAEVVVTYATAGTYTATLDVNHTDGTSGSQTFDIEVKVPTSRTGNLGIYTENTTVETSSSVATQNNQMVAISAVTTDAYEGSEALFFEYVWADGAYGYHATLNPDPSPLDASGYEEGFYNVAIKTTCVGKFKIRIRDASGGNFFVIMDDAVKTYGLERDGAWHKLKIPVSSFTKDGDGNGDKPDLSTLSNVFVLRSDEGSPTPADGDDWDFYVDDIYFSVD